MRNKTNGTGFAHNLYRLIEHCDENAKEVAYWSEEGDEIVIRDPSELEKNYLPRFFEKQPKFTSFVKQLNNYGFTKTNRGKNGVGLIKAEIFHHENFRKGAMSLLDQITLTSRRKASKTAPTASPNKEKLLQVIDERIKMALEHSKPSYVTELEQEVFRLQEKVKQLSQLVESFSLYEVKASRKNPPILAGSVVKNCEESTAHDVKQGPEHDQMHEIYHNLPQPALSQLRVDYNENHAPCNKLEKIKHANSDGTEKTMHSNPGFHFVQSKHPIPDKPHERTSIEKQPYDEQHIHPQQHIDTEHKGYASIATMSTISLDTAGPTSANIKRGTKVHQRHENDSADCMSTTETIENGLEEPKASSSIGSDLSLHSWLQAQKFHPVGNHMRLEEMSNVTYDLSSLGITENIDTSDRQSG